MKWGTVAWTKIKPRTGERHETYNELCKRRVLERVTLPDSPEAHCRVTKAFLLHIEKILPEIQQRIVQYHQQNGRSVQTIQEAIDKGLTTRGAILNAALSTALSSRRRLSAHEQRLRELILMYHLSHVYEQLHANKVVAGFPQPGPTERGENQ